MLVPFYINVLCFSFFQPCSRENVDRTSDERDYEDEILAEVVELEAEIEEDYQKKFAEYKKQLQEWKLCRRKQVPITVTLITQLFISLLQIYQYCVTG